MAQEINITKLRCKRCSHTWIPKKKDVRQCPHCKTAYWDTPKKTKSNLDKLIDSIPEEGSTTLGELGKALKKDQEENL